MSESVGIIRDTGNRWLEPGLSITEFLFGVSSSRFVSGGACSLYSFALRHLITIKTVTRTAATVQEQEIAIISPVDSYEEEYEA